MKILVATDGSPAAAEAGRVGLELAAREDASVAFLHVAQPGPDSEAVATSAAGENDLRRQAARGATLGVSCTLELVVGEIAETIVAHGRAIGADLIVVGSRGRSTAAGTLLGTVSRAVLRTADRPVLIVRGRTQPTAGN